jgi:hypothetical protein
MRWLFLLFATVVSISTACGGGSTPCVPGESKACACTNGRSGAQGCGDDGTFQACVCDSGSGGGGGQGQQCVVDQDGLPVLTSASTCDQCVKQSCGEQCQSYLLGYSDALDYGQCQHNCDSASTSCQQACEGLSGADYNACIGDCNVTQAQCDDGCQSNYLAGKQVCGALLQCETLWCQSPCNVS